MVVFEFDICFFVLVLFECGDLDVMGMVQMLMELFSFGFIVVMICSLVVLFQLELFDQLKVWFGVWYLGI